MQLNREKIQRMFTGSQANGGGGGGGDTDGLASELWVEQNYLSKEFFLRLFNIHGEDENDDPVDVQPNDLETTITDIEAMFGFWTEQYLSALGQNSEQGGGGITLNAALASINNAPLGNPTGTNTVLMFNGTTWVYATMGSTDMNTVWNALAAATNQQINISHLTTALSGYATTSQLSDYATVTDLEQLASYFNTLSGYFTNGAANEAVKLETARTIWGQQFDGTANITGDITQATCLEFSGIAGTATNGGFIDFHYAGGGADYTSRIIEDVSGVLKINNTIWAQLSGNVSIGTSTISQTYKLDVAGYTKTTRLYLADGVYLEYDSTNSGVHLVGAGFYSDSYVSALGVNSGGGGGTDYIPLTGSSSITGTLAPSVATADLGSATNKWRNIYGTSLSISNTLTTYALTVNSSATVVGSLTATNGNLVASTGYVSSAGGYKVTGKDDTYVLLAGGGTKALSTFGSGVSISVNGGTPIDPVSGVISITGLASTIYVGNTPYAATTAGVVNLPDYLPLTAGSTKKITGRLYLESSGGSEGIVSCKDTYAANTWARTIVYLMPNITAGGKPNFFLGKDTSKNNGGYIGFCWLADQSATNYVTFGLYATDEVLNITGNKYVGINTTAPTCALDINGYAQATGFKVSGQTGFLKANGTVDTNTYLTTALLSEYVKAIVINSSQPIAPDSAGVVNLGSFLPLSGGTLTGALKINSLGASTSSPLVVGTSTKTNIGTSVADQTTMIQIVAHTPSTSYTNSTAIGFHNPGISSAVIEARDTTTCTSINFRCDRTTWYVGIGTTTPQHKLHVVGDVYANSFAVVNGSSSGFLKANGTVDTNTYVTSASLGNYITGIVVNDDSPVGATNGVATLSNILRTTGGTMTGALKINVATDYESPALALNYTSSYTVSDTSLAQIKMGTTTYNAYLGVAPASRSKFGKVCYAYHIGSSYEYDWFSSSWDKVMALECSSGKLFVSGGAYFGSVADADSGRMPFTVCNNGYLTYGWAASFGTSGGGVLLGYGTRSSVSCAILGTSNATNLCIMPDGGNIGVGTTSPSYKLHVSGTFYASGDSAFGGTLSMAGNVTPSTDGQYSLGTSSKRFSAVYAGSFVKTGGTSSQFLKADGSVDSNTYLTSGDVVTTNTAQSITGAKTFTATLTSSAGGSFTGGLRFYSLCVECASDGTPSSSRYGEINRYNDTLHLQYDSGTGAVTMCRQGFTFTNPGTTSQLSTSNKNLQIAVGTGDAYVDKAWVINSDMRKKDIAQYINIDINSIADAPVFNFTWKNDITRQLTLGTSAQYWQTVFPNAVRQTPDGYLGMDYSSIALASAVLTARKVVDHEARIRLLEVENAALRNEINQLKKVA